VSGLNNQSLFETEPSAPTRQGAALLRESRLFVLAAAALYFPCLTSSTERIPAGPTAWRGGPQPRRQGGACWPICCVSVRRFGLVVWSCSSRSPDLDPAAFGWRLEAATGVILHRTPGLPAAAGSGSPKPCVVHSLEGRGSLAPGAWSEMSSRAPLQSGFGFTGATADPAYALRGDSVLSRHFSPREQTYAPRARLSFSPGAEMPVNRDRVAAQSVAGSACAREAEARWQRPRDEHLRPGPRGRGTATFQ